MMELLYFGIILLGRISFETKFFKTFFSDIDAREAVLWGMQTLANEGFNDLIS